MTATSSRNALSALVPLHMGLVVLYGQCGSTASALPELVAVTTTGVHQHTRVVVVVGSIYQAHISAHHGGLVV